MPKYQVLIDARNFLVRLDERVDRYGFIAHRVVKAPDRKAAENLAVQMLREDQELRSLVLNDKTDPPVMDVTEIIELEDSEIPTEAPGRIWYEMNPRRWWQFWRR